MTAETFVYCKAHLGVHIDADGICGILDDHRAGTDDTQALPNVEPRCLPLDAATRDAALTEARINGWPIAYENNTHTWSVYGELVPRRSPSRPS